MTLATLASGAGLLAGLPFNILLNIILCLSHNISLSSLSCAHTFFFYLNLLILAESIFKLYVSSRLGFISSMRYVPYVARRDIKEIK